MFWALVNSIVFIWGFLLFSSKSSRLGRLRAMRSWPKSPGTIIESSIETTVEFQIYRFAVAYTYAVGGTRYDGNRLRDLPGNLTHLEASSFLEHFPAGASVDVFHSPKDPKDSVLINKLPEGREVRMLVLGLLMWVTAVMIAFWKEFGN